MDKRQSWKKICGIMLTLVLMVPCLVMPAYAAEGPYTVSGEYKPNGVALPGATEFELYEVGGFARKEGNDAISILKLNDAIKDAGYTGNISLGYKTSESGEESKWEDQDWLNDAKTLSDFIVDKKDKFGHKTVSTEGGAFSFSGLGNGLYLLRSDDKQKVAKGGDKANDFTYYSPLPMYIQVLNGNVTGISVKSIEENAKDFRVTKVWDDKDKTALRPSEIKVEILYDGKVFETQTLNEDNNWTYFWEADKDHLDKQWIVREVMDEETAANYYCTTVPTPDEKNHLLHTKITNTYKRLDLEIVKNTDKLARLGDGSNITAVFEIVGKRDGKEVFKTNAGVVIDAATKTINVKNIPRNLDELLVTEVYAGGNYTASPSGAQKASFVYEVPEEPAEGSEESGEEAAPADPMNGHYSVTFSNTLGDPTVISHGIVNKYKRTENGVKIVDRVGR